MRPNNEEVIVHKNKGSRALNVVMHALPTASVVPLAVARVLYTPCDPETIATIALMAAGVALPAMGTFAEFKEKLSSRGKQGVLTLSNASMLTAVALMMMGTIPATKESDPARIALAGMVLFALASVLEIPYRAARGLDLIGSKLPLELTAVVSAFVGSLAFLAAQVVAYAQARESNKQDKQALMNTAILLAFTSLGFILSTGNGIYQISKAMRGGSVDPDLRAALEEEGRGAYTPRFSCATPVVGAKPDQTTVVVDALAAPLLSPPTSPTMAV